MSSSHRRGPWSQGEDAYLIQLVHTQGALNWVRIAQLIGSRCPKQCQERYHQHLKPSLNHEPIRPEEGLQIERLVGEMGKRWTEIARRLNGRSDNAVKNWWNGSMNRRRRLVLRRRTSSQCLNTSGERAQSLSFAGAASKQAFAISSSNYFSRGGMDSSLLSPAVSKASRAESVDDSPSIVSVNDLAFSVSPQLTTSPSLELSTLNTFRDARRPSLPMLQFRPKAFHSVTDHQALPFSSRFRDGHESHSLGSLSSSPPVYRRPEQHVALPHSQRHYYYDSCGQPLTPPSTPLQLAPLIMNAQLERPEQSSERDTRMHLSSLLG